MKMEYEEAESFFSRVYLGKHHIPSKIHSFGQGFYINHYGDLSTFDFNTLTRLVFHAHDQCVRVEIGQSGPRMVKVIIHKREKRLSDKGSFWEIHPTLDEAIADWRSRGNIPIEQERVDNQT
jgi:hypothetical protein